MRFHRFSASHAREHLRRSKNLGPDVPTTDFTRCRVTQNSKLKKRPVSRSHADMLNIAFVLLCFTAPLVPSRRTSSPTFDQERNRSPIGYSDRGPCAPQPDRGGVAMSRAEELRKRSEEAGKRASEAKTEQERALLEKIQAGLNDLAEIEDRLERMRRRK
ncbi:MAG TPA: hypothetical protein VEM36_01435 [Xanthobacteraceae bacterium]|nr:hypothetical protein [Xanthobacteraceae bacterium]